MDYLIIDTPESARYLSELLKKSGSKTHIASTTDSAIEVLDRYINTIDCVVFDTIVAHRSILEFLYEMRSYADMSDIRLVAYSSVPLPRSVTSSLDWKLLDIEKFFLKSQHSVKEMCDYLMHTEKEHRELP